MSLLLLLVLFWLPLHAQSLTAPAPERALEILQSLCHEKVLKGIDCTTIGSETRRFEAVQLSLLLIQHPQRASFSKEVAEKVRQLEQIFAEDLPPQQTPKSPGVPESKTEAGTSPSLTGQTLFTPRKRLRGDIRLWLEGNVLSSELKARLRDFTRKENTGFAQRVRFFTSIPLSQALELFIHSQGEQVDSIPGKYPAFHFEPSHRLVLRLKTKKTKVSIGTDYVRPSPLGLLLHDNYFPFEAIQGEREWGKVTLFGILGFARRPFGTPPEKAMPFGNLLPLGGQIRFPQGGRKKYAYRALRIVYPLGKASFGFNLLLHADPDAQQGKGIDLVYGKWKAEWANFSSQATSGKALLATYTTKVLPFRIHLTYSNIDAGFLPHYSALQISEDEVEAGGLPRSVQPNEIGYALDASVKSFALKWHLRITDGKTKQGVDRLATFRLKATKELAPGYTFGLEYGQIGKRALVRRVRTIIQVGF